MKMLLCACVVAMGVAVTARADDKPAAVKVGDPAPKFESVDDQGKPWKSADHVGKKVLVVYFYPADMTKEEFESHLVKNPQDKTAFTG